MRVLSHTIPYKFLGTQSAVTVLHTGSTTVLAANSERGYLLFQNNGANNIHLSMDGTDASTADFVIASGGGSLELAEGVPTGKISGLALTGSTVLVVLEG